MYKQVSLFDKDERCDRCVQFNKEQTEALIEALNRKSRKISALSTELSELELKIANAEKQAVEEFAQYLIEYAEMVQENDYDGIGAQDIKDKLKEYLK